MSPLQQYLSLLYIQVTAEQLNEVIVKVLLSILIAFLLCHVFDIVMRKNADIKKIQFPDFPEFGFFIRMFISKTHKQAFSAPVFHHKRQIPLHIGVYPPQASGTG